MGLCGRWCSLSESGSLGPWCAVIRAGLGPMNGDGRKDPRAVRDAYGLLKLPACLQMASSGWPCSRSSPCHSSFSETALPPSRPQKIGRLGIPQARRYGKMCGPGCNSTYRRSPGPILHHDCRTKYLPSSASTCCRRGRWPARWHPAGPCRTILTCWDMRHRGGPRRQHGSCWSAWARSA